MENINKNNEINESLPDYFTSMYNFFNEHNFVEVKSANDVELQTQKIYKSDQSNGINKKTYEVQGEMLENLKTPEFLKSFFEKSEFKNIPSKSIVNESGSTLFISAGAQVLDPIIHDEKEIFAEKIYIAQPVFRTQFIPKINEGVSSSFINIATEMVNKTPEEHFRALDQWMELLNILGLNKENIILKSIERYDKWGKRKFLQKILKIYYGDLEIGDALYIDMPQNSRENILISDIGFGLDRIKWLLSADKSYFQAIAPDSEAFLNLDNKTIDYTRTLSLLAGFGVKPSNNEHGYRFRQLSKLLVKTNLGKKINLNNLIKLWYNDWQKWTNFPTSEEDIEKIINMENERNLNREILDILKEDYPDVDININQSTDKIIKLLKGTSVDEKYLQEVLEKLL